MNNEELGERTLKPGDLITVDDYQMWPYNLVEWTTEPAPYAGEPVVFCSMQLFHHDPKRGNIKALHPDHGVVFFLSAIPTALPRE